MKSWRGERLQQHEGWLSGMLRGNRRMRGSDILYLQERLFRAGVDESLLSQRRLDLERWAVASTVTVELFEPGTMPLPDTTRTVNLAQRFTGAAQTARTGINHQLARGATAGAYALVYAPVWGPAFVIALLRLRWAWVRRREILAWIVAVLARGLALAAQVIRWVRTAREARHQEINFSPVSEEGRRTRAEAQRM